MKLRSECKCRCHTQPNVYHIMACCRMDDPTNDPDLCEYCQDHPSEPGYPCCDNSFCKEAYLKEKRDGKY